jgi:uncharacterized protein (DUF58 family)
MTAARTLTPFELVPQSRFAGAAFGRRRSVRRGQGDEVTGTRSYRPGDPPAHIDWPASARLSAARGADVFVVREFYADEAPRVGIARDLRPAMALRGGPPPWLDKAAAAETVVDLVTASAAAERADVSRTDGASLQVALDSVARDIRSLTLGSFVFAISDFLEPVRGATWLRLRALGCDVVPVVVQDPVWERSFPAVGGVVLPLADPAGGDPLDVWLTPRDARRRATENEQRHASVMGRFRRLGFDPVIVDTADALAISQRFHAWAARRRRALTVRR